MAKRIVKLWYVLKAEDGKEGRIKREIMRKARIKDLERFFGKILIPRVRRVELRNGKRVVVNEEKYPGYVLVQLQINEETYHLVRDCRYVFGFVEMDLYGRITKNEDTSVKAPVPVEHDEMLWLLMEDRVARTAMKEKSPKLCKFEVGEIIKVTDGLYKGKVLEVKKAIPGEEAKVQVTVSILGINLDVEIPCWQARKAKTSEL